MRLPKQAASVDRELSINASEAGQVAAAGWLDTLGTIAKVAAPIVSSFI